MNVLLYTHIALWAAAGDGELSDKAVDIIEGAANTLYVSVAAIHEIAIKHPEVVGRARRLERKGGKRVVPCPAAKGRPTRPAATLPSRANCHVRLLNFRVGVGPIALPLFRTYLCHMRN